MNKELGIFVPARLSSQRLPNKQILPLRESCMFDMCCQKLEYITTSYNINTYVLICDNELIKIASKYPHIQIIHRDPVTTTVDGPLNFIYKDILNTSEKYLMFLNPCLTFLTTETIINSINTFLASGKDYGTSVKPFKNWLWNTDNIAMNYIDYQGLNTKEITPWWQAAHCFHIFNQEKFKQDGYMLNSDLCLLDIPEEETLDIDTLEEYTYVKWKWEH